MVEYFVAHYHQILKALVEHIELCVLSLAVSIVIALPAGYLLSRFSKRAKALLGFLSVLYAVPSMALLVLLVPVFGLGNISAVIALIFYAQFILVRSVFSGFQSIDPVVLESARGMGLNAWERFVCIEFPLALPSFINGLRVASTSVISIASIAAWINAGGLGTLLFEGIYQHNNAELFWGVMLIAALALLAETALSNIEHLTILECEGLP